MPATTAKDVLFYVPNLIGYFRIISTLLSLFLMMAYPNLWLIAVILYVSSFVGDLFGTFQYELKRHDTYFAHRDSRRLLSNFPPLLILPCCNASDGIVARKLNQTSTFGGLLDMVTDRCSTLGLLYVLGGEYEAVDVSIGFPAFRFVSLLKEQEEENERLRFAHHFVLLASDLLVADTAGHQLPLVPNVFHKRAWEAPQIR